MAAIEKLGYEPNQAARTLVTRRTSMLEVITHGLAYYGPAQFVGGVEHTAKAHGYRVIFSSLEDMQAIRRNGVNADGAIAIVPLQSLVFDELERAFNNVPLIKIGIRPGDTAASVVIDQASGTRQITEYLLQMGHRQIAYISGPSGWFDADVRQEAWLETLHMHQITPGRIETAEWTAESGYLAAQRLLAATPPEQKFTALVVANDQMALGAISALKASGLRVPEDVSVVGFDAVPESAYFDPPLTTVHQDMFQVGKQSVEYLVQLIQQPETPLRQQLLQPELVIRQSVQRIAS
jgi:LacI family transcriptional regulator